MFLEQKYYPYASYGIGRGRASEILRGLTVEETSRADS